jgi:cell division protein FtsI (penicillin-binding protein 3)
MPGRTVHRGRLLFVLFVVCAIALAAVVRTAQWQVLERGRLVALAERQTTIRVSEPMQRGTIYDRTGTVVLASTVERDRLVGSPGRLGPAERATVADTLVGLLGLAGDDAATLRDRFTTDSTYTVLRVGLDGPTAEKVRAALADGTVAAVSLEREPVRVYPQAGGGKDSTLAAQLLGFVNADGEGQYGVEAFYQDALAGLPRVLLTGRDVNDRPMWDTARVEQPGVAGSDIRLTIDASLQLRLEQQVFAAWVADRAASVSGIVLDPLTGEVLAEATYPSYDGNDYRAVATKDPGRFLDPNISAVYEPGSVAKMFLASAAYERKIVKPTTKINDSGVLKVANGKVYDADHRARGLMTFKDIVAYSRNVGVSRVALRLGKTLAESSGAMYDTWAKYGLGARTGIDLAGELDGLVNDPGVRRWTELDLANASFGQGVAVTPMQLAVAYAAMANGGFRVTPRVVASIGDRELPRPPQERIISAELSSQLVSLMRHVVVGVDYYRVKTDIHNYLIGGKTGTAEIWDPELNGGRGAFRQNVFNFSFVGYVGQWKPQVVIAITIRAGHPTVYGQGSMELPMQSFDLFRRIAQDSIAMLGIAPRTPGGDPSASPKPGASGSPAASGGAATSSAAPGAVAAPAVSPGAPDGTAGPIVTAGGVTWDPAREVPAGEAPPAEATTSP